jgi:hypothetical protein
MHIIPYMLEQEGKLPARERTILIIKELTHTIETLHEEAKKNRRVIKELKELQVGTFW